MSTQAAVAERLHTYTIDPSHSQIGFKVRHLGFSKVRGRFDEFSGTVRMAPSQLATLKAEAVINAASVNTGVDDRDEHLRSGDFFDVEAYPKLTFEATEVREVSAYAFTLVGALTLHGVTRPVELDAVFLGEAEDPWGGRRIAFEAETTISRKDFGLTWNSVLETGGLLVGEDVEISLEVQAVLEQD